VFTFELDLTEYEPAKKATKTRIRVIAHETVNEALNEGVAVAKAGPFKDQTGTLRRTIGRTPARMSVNESVGHLNAPQEYASFVESGTDPHDIYPQDRSRAGGPHHRSGRRAGKRVKNPVHRAGGGSFLRFRIGGQVVFARFVKHPGSKPYPFMGPAYQAMERLMPALIERKAEELQRDIWE
jgi:hypothetical protein